MSEQSEVIVPATPTSTVPRSGLLDGARQLAYAWIGMWGVASDDLGDFYSRCVTRGAQIMNAKPPAAHTPVKPQMNDTGVSQPSVPASRRSRPVSVINAFAVVKPYHIDLNVDGELPTKEEFAALLERVEALSREVDGLVERRQQEQ